MKKLVCLILLLVACRFCEGQNLVPNPSFEDTVSCPVGLNEVDKAVGWINLANTPDYFNRCSSGPQVGVPYNQFGYKQPATGDAYCGFYTYSTIAPYREIIGTNLIQTMQVGIKYYVSFKLSAASFSSNGGTNKTGILFSTMPYNFTNPPPVNNFSQIFVDSIISDTTNWIQIHLSFIADSSYTFISIANFFDNQHTDTIHIFQGVPNYLCYQMIDDVCISTDSLTCNPPTGIIEIKTNNDIVLFPNPFTDKLNITLKTNEPVEVTLYDITSRKILNQKFTTSTTINTQQLAKGIYIYEVRNINGPDSYRDKKGKVVKD